jgi:hypothetical protein
METNLSIEQYKKDEQTLLALNDKMSGKKHTEIFDDKIANFKD